MSLRIASADDWDDISRISTASGYDDYINTIGPSYMEDGVVVVYEENGISGFGKINYLNDGSAWLSGLRVHPDAWRSGIGYRISDHLVHMAREMGCTEARMLIEDHNIRSISLSSKMDFRPIASYGFFDGSPETEDWKDSDFNDTLMVNEGWYFVVLNDAYRGNGKFRESPGKTLAYVWNGNTNLVQIVRCGKDLRLEKEGITCISSSEAKSLNGKFKPLQDFESATVYEKKLLADPRKL
ncbi:MAG: hypothetical protein B2I17_05700 [Thermoplasmatales archaeon B_DKE]|nr:MAG: hypothetical protein B2I17_05700 [Thermoplasmatales archaeon B_DKE]QRF75174.1 Acetyltransferase (GNAT) family protein [Thermoplasmatales archaeon]